MWLTDNFLHKLCYLIFVLLLYSSDIYVPLWFSGEQADMLHAHVAITAQLGQRWAQLWEASLGKEGKLGK